MSSNNVFDKLNEEMNESELADDAVYSVQSCNADSSIKEWFETSEYSPEKFRSNNITKVVASNLAAKYIYNSAHVYEPVDTLMICSASIKSCPLVFEDVEYDDLSDYELDENTEEFKKNAEADKKKEFTSLLIYGHNEDYNDDFNSRLDQRLIDMISRDFKHKYSRVCLFGCFESIDGLKNIINQVYERLTDKGLFTRVAIYLDSKVRDDDGKWRTLADVINSGYVKPTVVDTPNIVEYIMKKFDKKNIARLFTKKLKINTTKNLFDNVQIPTVKDNKSDEPENFFDDNDADFFNDSDKTSDLPF